MKNRMPNKMSMLFNKIIRSCFKNQQLNYNSDLYMVEGTAKKVEDIDFHQVGILFSSEEISYFSEIFHFGWSGKSLQRRFFRQKFLEGLRHS